MKTFKRVKRSIYNVLENGKVIGSICATPYNVHQISVKLSPDEVFAAKMQARRDISYLL